MLTKILFLPLVLTMFLSLPGGWLGIELDDERPLTVKLVVAGSPAAKAGIRPGDVFRAVNGRRVRNEDALMEMFAGFEPRQKIKLTMQRGDRQLQLQVTLARRPGEEPAAVGKPYVGIDIDPAEGGGLLVAGVRENGPAAAARLRKGDIVTAINDQRIRNFEDLDKVMAKLRPGAKVVVSLRRGDNAMRRPLVLGTFPEDIARAEGRERQPQPRRREQPQPRRQPRRPRQPTRRPVDDLGFSSDYQGCLTAARRTGKPVLLVFGASWSEDCHTLRKSLEHASLKRLLGGYERVWLDTDKAGRLADRHNVQGLPHVEILDSRGQRIAKMVGHQTPEALRTALRKGSAAGRAGGQPRQPDRRGNRRGDRRDQGAGAVTVQQMQREVSRLRQQLQKLQREQAEQRRQMQEILRRLRDR